MSKLAPAESISILRAEPLLGLAFLDHAGSQLKSEASCERSHGVARPRRFPTNCRGHFLPASCRAHHNRLSSCFPYGTLFCMQPSRSKRPALHQREMFATAHSADSRLVLISSVLSWTLLRHEKGRILSYALRKAATSELALPYSALALPQKYMACHVFFGRYQGTFSDTNY